MCVMFLLVELNIIHNLDKKLNLVILSSEFLFSRREHIMHYEW